MQMTGECSRVMTGASIWVSATQSARTLRRNLVSFGPKLHMDPLKIRKKRGKLSKFRADLTLNHVDNHKIDPKESLVPWDQLCDSL